MRMATTPFASRQQQPHTLSLSWSSVVAAVASSRSFHYKLISRKREFLVSFLCLTFESQNERTNRLNFSLSPSSSSSMAVSVCMCVCACGLGNYDERKCPKAVRKMCLRSQHIPPVLTVRRATGTTRSSWVRFSSSRDMHLQFGTDRPTDRPTKRHATLSFFPFRSSCCCSCCCFPLTSERTPRVVVVVVAVLNSSSSFTFYEASFVTQQQQQQQQTDHILVETS